MIEIVSSFVAQAWPGTAIDSLCPCPKEKNSWNYNSKREDREEEDQG